MEGRFSRPEVGVAVLLVYTTAPSLEGALRIAREAAGRRLAAYAQVLGPMTSVYWWRGRVEEGEEWLCVMKTTEDRLGELESLVGSLHPYEVPEFVAVPARYVGRECLGWLRGDFSGAQGPANLL